MRNILYLISYSRLNVLFVAVMILLSIDINNSQGQSRIHKGQSISELFVVGNERIESSTIRSYLKIDIGDIYDPLRVDQSLKALFGTGLFSDVSIRRDESSLVVEVVENPIINRLVFEGNKRIEDEVLEKEVRLRPRVVFTRSRVRADTQRLIQIYQRGGRFAAKVEPKIVKLEQNRVDLVFEIEEGSVTGISRIGFIGNKTFDDSELREAIQTKETRWYRFLTGDDTYDSDRLTLDRELLRKFYLERGHADFRVVSAVAELSLDRTGFFITFTIEEGPQYQFGSIGIESNLRNIQIDSLQSGLIARKGNTYNSKEIDKTIESLLFAVGEQGYAFIEVIPEIIRRDKDREIDIVFKLDEGPKVYVERINIVGNSRTLDSVIRREMRLAEGDAFNAAKIRTSRRKITGLGFFDKIDVSKEQGTSGEKVILNLEVQERSTGELSFGFGVSSTESVVGDVSIRERNLGGKGQDLKLSASLSPRRQRFDLKFTEPYFLDRKLAAGFDIFNVQKDLQSRSSFDENTTGLRLRSKFDITEDLRQSVNYTIRQDEISGLGDSASPLLSRDVGDFLTSSAGVSLTYDTRNDPFRTKEGLLISGSQNLAGLGGDIKYLQTDLFYSYFHPFPGNFVGNMEIKGGYIIGLGQDVRVTDRYFLGGRNFLGFESGGIGPRDSATQDSLGGTAYYVATGQMSFPIGLPNELGVLGRAFSQLGVLTDSDLSGTGIQDATTPRLSAGLGMSWLSPFGPIEVDFTQALVKEDFDKDEVFRFGFGTRF